MPLVLVVDDDDELRSFVRQILASAGFAVVEARDGSEAVRMLQTQIVDLVICDLFMPNKEGLETIRALRRQFADLPIIAMSGGGAAGLPATGLLQVAVQLGASRALQKPFAALDLLELVRDCL